MILADLGSCPDSWSQHNQYLVNVVFADGQTLALHPWPTYAPFELQGRARMQSS